MIFSIGPYIPTPAWPLGARVNLPWQTSGLKIEVESHSRLERRPTCVSRWHVTAVRG